MTIDFAPVLEIALTTAFGVVVFYVRKLAKQAFDWLGLKKDGEVRAYLQDALTNGLEFGYAEARRQLGEVASEVTVRNKALQFAAHYVRQRVPDALRHFNIQPADVNDLLLARDATPAQGAEVEPS